MPRERQQTITVAGVERQLSAARAREFEVVRAVLLGSLTLAQGARRLRLPQHNLQRLVEGARRAVIAAGLERELAATDRSEYVGREARVLGLTGEQHV